ncbi:mitochondrial resolvase Ydc2 [Biscogniauxia sp. FL1348]|nr:mitochondrial resolvase Ydc2 [Biscogniauxia sp. FL1348]
MVSTPNPKTVTTIASALSASFVSPALKAAQLQRLAFLCGISKTGTKTELVARLNAAALAATAAAAAPAEGWPGSEQRILSIDLGIRNLAFSLITAKPSSPSSPSSSSSSPSPLPMHPPHIQLHAWKHRVLLERPPTKGASGEDEKGGEGEKEVDADAETGTSPDLYSPASLARVTTALVRDDLLPLRPTHVLIERQRFRSCGHAAVQEWTLRVNTLEAMLHAALRTVREYGLWDTGTPGSAIAGVDAGGSPEKTTSKKGKGRSKGKKDAEDEKVVTGSSGDVAQGGEVISVPPSRVAQFWLEDIVGDMIATEAGTTSKAKAKAEAEAVIETSIEQEKEFYLSEEDDEILEEPDPEKKTVKITSKPKPKRANKSPLAKNLDKQGTKRLKIKLLARWLSQGADPNTVTFAPTSPPHPPRAIPSKNRGITTTTATTTSIITPATPSIATALATYLRRATRGRRRTSVKPQPGETTSQARAEVDEDAALGPKLDDLTDSLLQGMAWLRWEENRLLLSRPGGVEKMLLLEGGEEEGKKKEERKGKGGKKKGEEKEEVKGKQKKAGQKGQTKTPTATAAAAATRAKKVNKSKT